MPAPVKTGRAVPGIYVRPRTSEQQAVLRAAAKAAKVSLPMYLLESALMVADHEGFHVAPAWKPRIKLSPE